MRARYTQPPDGRLKTQSAIEALYEGLRPYEDRVIVSTGVGNHQMMACQFFRWTQPRQFITSGSLGTMGFGLPAAIGIQAPESIQTGMFCRIIVSTHKVTRDFE